MFYICSGLLGLIRCTTVSPDGNWIAVGFSSGVLSILDARSGILTASWKAHDGEILQVSKQFKLINPVLLKRSVVTYQ